MFELKSDAFDTAGILIKKHVRLTTGRNLPRHLGTLHANIAYAMETERLPQIPFFTMTDDPPVQSPSVTYERR